MLSDGPDASNLGDCVGGTPDTRSLRLVSSTASTRFRLAAAVLVCKLMLCRSLGNLKQAFAVVPVVRADRIESRGQQF